MTPSIEENTPCTTTVPSLKESKDEEECYIAPIDAQQDAEDISLFFAKPLFQKGDRELANARKIYLKIFLPGVFLIAVTILAVFSIYWGSTWTIPTHTLPGWIVDLDGGDVGDFVVQNLRSLSQNGPISWNAVSSNQFNRGLAGVAEGIRENSAWVAVVVNEGSSNRLRSSIVNANTSYNGEEAVIILVNEARNENAYRNIIRPSVEASVQALALRFRIELAANLSSTSNMVSLLATSPQTVVNPISSTLVNLVPFTQPVAFATLTSGLIFVLIMSYFVVMIAANAREASGLNRQLSFKSLITLRLGSAFIAYFFLSLMYTFVNLGFKLDMGHKYGHAGFVIFWIVSWIYMLAVGLALESLITLLKQFVPFFLITWIIVNVSTNSYPLEVLPRIFHYGYATPFYNVSKAIRTIVFGTKNTFGLNIGVLLVWVLISCASLVFFQWNARRQAINAMSKKP